MGELEQEIIENGPDRLITLGSSAEDLGVVMELYYPDAEERNEKYLQILRGFIEKGYLNGRQVRLTPHNPELNVSDQALDKELRGM